jgi:peptide deformylase
MGRPGSGQKRSFAVSFQVVWCFLSAIIAAGSPIFAARGKLPPGWPGCDEEKNMIREIIRDEAFLRRPSVPATKKDKKTAEDLRDTLMAHALDCVGLAANMIGEAKCVIAIRVGKSCLVMLNPEIVRHSAEQYETEEGCLSLEGTRRTRRYEWVEIAYRDKKGKPQTVRLKGQEAQAAQHEIDHTRGILI